MLGNENNLDLKFEELESNSVQMHQDIWTLEQHISQIISILDDSTA